jgi:uncharacterized protein
VGAHPFLVPITSLRRTPGARREEHRRGVLASEPTEPELQVTGTTVPSGAELAVDVVLEVVDGGIVVAGEVHAPWRGECRRCLRPVEGMLDAEVRELYRPHPDGDADEDEDTYPLGTHHLDLRPLARDAVLLDLPLAPLCRPDCAGLCPTCGADLNDGPCSCPAPATDPRWAALDGLRGAAAGGDQAGG